jgi:hypothetical protein
MIVGHTKTADMLKSAGRYTLVGFSFLTVLGAALGFILIADQCGRFTVLAERYREWEKTSFARSTRGHM